MSKIRVLALLVVAALGVALLGGCTGSDEPTFEVGDTVAAEWEDAKLYLSEVTAVEDDQVTVTYLDDDTSDTLNESQVRAIEDKEWQVDDRVLAVWSVARFYSGTITEVQDDGYMVAWDDGSTPSLVPADEIIAYEEKYADDSMADETTDDSSTDSNSDTQMSDLVGDWTNSDGSIISALSLAADGSGTATDIDGTTVDIDWSYADGYLEITIYEPDGSEGTTGATMTMVSENEFTWDAESGSFVR